MCQRLMSSGFMTTVISKVSQSENWEEAFKYLLKKGVKTRDEGLTFICSLHQNKANWHFEWSAQK